MFDETYKKGWSNVDEDRRILSEKMKELDSLPR
jgi:hypothetical protein